MAYSLANVTKDTTVDKNGGTKKFFHIADVNDFSTLQTYDSYSSAGDEVTISSNHAFSAGKAFAKVYITDDTGEVTVENIGSRDGRSKKITFKAFHPGSNKIFGEAERNWKNLDAIVLVPMADGKVLQLGAAGAECEVLATWKSNTRSGNGAGYDIEITCFTNSLTFYEGTIDNTF